MLPALREDWFAETVRECQVMICHALHERDQACMDLIADFVCRIPEPRSPTETIVLRGCLLDVCLTWGESDHRSYHRVYEPDASCVLSPGDVTVRAWSNRAREPKVALREWGLAYCAAFDAAHPLHRAIELRNKIDSHFADRNCVSAFIRGSGAAPRRLQTDFTRLTGTTILQYRTGRRVAAAIAHLLQSDDKTHVIAETVGWSSRKDLNRALRRYVELSPTAIRRSGGFVGFRARVGGGRHSVVQGQILDHLSRDIQRMYSQEPERPDVVP